MRKSWWHPALCLYLSALGILTGWQPAVAQEAKPVTSADLKIVVLEGEDGVNFIKKKTAVRPVVEVRDRNDAPVAGASVVFLLPQYGPGGTFASGGKMMTVVTDSAGRATAGAMQPSGSGAFKISITASHQGHTATTTISQTNQVAAAAGGVSGATIGIIVGVAAAAAVGLGVGLSGGKSNGGGNNQPQVPSATISAGGGPVFGPPR
jgi:hypothetical protein